MGVCVCFFGDLLFVCFLVPLGFILFPRYRRHDLWIALVVCDWLAPVYVCVPLLITFRMGFCAIKLDAVFHKEIRRNKAHAV